MRASDKIDLTPVRDGLVKRDGLSEDHADRCIALYKLFLDMNAEHPNQQTAPTRDVDRAWHRHILLTKRYIDDCNTMFGGYLIHDPETYLTEEWCEAWEFTRKWFAQHGYDLPADESYGEVGLQPYCCWMPNVTPVKVRNAA